MSSTPFSEASLQLISSTPKFSPSQFGDLNNSDNEFNIFCSSRLKRHDAMSPLTIVESGYSSKKDEDASFASKSVSGTPMHFKIPDFDSLFNSSATSSALLQENSPLFKLINTPGTTDHDISMYKNLCGDESSATPIEQILSALKIAPMLPRKPRSRALTRLNNGVKIVENFWDKIKNCEEGINSGKKRVHTPKNATKLHRRRTGKLSKLPDST